jgi:diguanylate cyclase (GGDEF)-like protein
MLGLSPDEIGDDPESWFGRVHADDLPHVRQALAAHRAGQTPQFESEHRIQHNDESYRWVLSRGMAIRDEEGRATRMAGSQTDITRGKAADPLTGLANRVLFMDHLNSAIHGERGNDRAMFAVLFLDLDRFKVINDSLGHHAGDELLVTIARRLESCLRSTDVVGRVADRCTISRFGGDEFVVLLRGISDPANAGLVADRILAVLSEPMSLRGHEITVSASIGVAVGTCGVETSDDLLRDADTAMYEAKSQGKSRWCLFDQDMRTQAIERLQLEADLKHALEHHEFEVYYQPIVEFSSGTIKGLEALLRWQHPRRGTVLPTEFVPMAEEIGLITDIGAWVLESACRHARGWQSGVPDCGSLFVSVNVSSKQFRDPLLADRVRECLAATGLEGGSLNLEITESAIMADPSAAAETLEQLREMGVGISIDDFGTGYSSLSYLQRFKIDRLKIDRSFVARMGDSEESDEIVRTIVNLAHNLGMEVTAEGIEQQAQHDRLQEIACGSGQGFLYSQPVPESDVAALLKDRTARLEPNRAAATTSVDAILSDIELNLDLASAHA